MERLQVERLNNGNLELGAQSQLKLALLFNTNQLVLINAPSKALIKINGERRKVDTYKK